MKELNVVFINGEIYIVHLTKRGGSRIPPRRGRQPSNRGRQPTILPKISIKPHEIVKILGGGRAGSAPLDPPLTKIS